MLRVKCQPFYLWEENVELWVPLVQVPTLLGISAGYGLSCFCGPNRLPCARLARSLVSGCFGYASTWQVGRHYRSVDFWFANFVWLSTSTDMPAACWVMLVLSTPETLNALHRLFWGIKLMFFCFVGECYLFQLPRSNTGALIWSWNMSLLE
jgi:hypothetical protein